MVLVRKYPHTSRSPNKVHGKYVTGYNPNIEYIYNTSGKYLTHQTYLKYRQSVMFRHAVSGIRTMSVLRF